MSKNFTSLRNEVIACIDSLRVEFFSRFEGRACPRWSKGWE